MKFFLIIFIFFAMTINIFADPPTAPVKSDQQIQEQEKQQQALLADQAANKTNRSFFEDATYDNFENQTGETLKEINNKVIDPGTVTLIQSTFLEKLRKAFSSVAEYALNLLYLFTVLELVIFGLIWALQRDIGFDKLFFKIIKIGLIFFIIQNYSWLLDTILQSFTKIAGIVINNTETDKYVFNPAMIWQYGYDFGVKLLKQATTGNNFGMAMIQVSLGMGILFTFGLLGIQMISQIISFYFVSLGALILLPFGAFTLGKGMFEKAVQSVFQAGIRLMSLIIIIGIAVAVWDEFRLTEMPKEFNINQPLGLFFTALLFLCLSFYIPKLLSQAVGSFSHNFFDGNSPSSIITRESTGTTYTMDTGSNDMRAATTIEAANISTGGGYTSRESINTAIQIPTSANTLSSNSNTESKISKETLAKTSDISKIKEAILKAVKEKK